MSVLTGRTRPRHSRKYTDRRQAFLSRPPNSGSPSASIMQYGPEPTLVSERESLARRARRSASAAAQENRSGGGPDLSWLVRRRSGASDRAASTSAPRASSGPPAHGRRLLMPPHALGLDHEPVHAALVTGAGLAWPRSALTLAARCAPDAKLLTHARGALTAWPRVFASAAPQDHHVGSAFAG